MHTHTYKGDKMHLQENNYLRGIGEPLNYIR